MLLGELNLGSYYRIPGQLPVFFDGALEKVIPALQKLSLETTYLQQDKVAPDRMQTTNNKTVVLP